jgi:UDP-glucose 4-epimerase
VHALEHAVRNSLPGIYNVAADGVLALSEVAGLLGKPYAPVLPFWGTGLAVSVLRRLGLRIPQEMVNQLRYGRGVDNRRYKAAGFVYQYTSREAVLKLGEHFRLHPLVRDAQQPYRYEREVEEFLRWSPHVRGSLADQGVQREPPPPLRRGPERYDDLEAVEVIALLESLEPDALDALLAHERAHRAREQVVIALETVLARSESAG